VIGEGEETAEAEDAETEEESKEEEEEEEENEEVETENGEATALREEKAVLRTHLSFHFIMIDEC
jgi:hypothetical protein